MRRGVFFKTRMAEGFVEFLGAGDSPDWPHPEGKTWGVVRDDGEWMVFAGRVCAVVAPGSVVRAIQQKGYPAEGLRLRRG